MSAQIPELETGRWYACFRQTDDPVADEPIAVGKYVGVETFDGEAYYEFSPKLMSFDDHTLVSFGGPSFHVKKEGSDLQVRPIAVPTGADLSTWQPTTWPLTLAGGKRRSTRRRRGSRKSKRGSRRH